ncbi:MAG: pyridoxal-dependent decarboxylase, partial [Firmicutes bacterium]|nr:pyridoxal-dependent decarboxylase [Bacillota bacterium]
EMSTYTLNFSRSADRLLAQYYNLLRLGVKGFTDIATVILKNAQFLAQKLAETQRFQLINAAEHLPVVTWKLKESTAYTVFDIAKKLRESGWIVPAYTLPILKAAWQVLRVVVKENFSRDMIERFVADLIAVVDELDGRSAALSSPNSCPKTWPVT